MDFSKLTIDEAREFLARNGVQENSLDTLTVQSRALQIYTERMQTGNLVYTLIFLALDRAARFPSNNKYTESQIINMTPEQMQVFGQYYQFDVTQTYAKPFLWRVLQLQDNALPEPVTLPVFQPVIEEQYVPTIASSQSIQRTVDIEAEDADIQYEKRVRSVFDNVDKMDEKITNGFILLQNKLESHKINTSFDWTDRKSVKNLAVRTYIDMKNTFGKINDGDKIPIKLIDIAISRPRYTQYTMGRLNNLTDEQMNNLILYYKLDPLVAGKDRNLQIQILYQILKYQGNIEDAYQPFIQSTIQPMVQPTNQLIVPPKKSIIKTPDYLERESRAEKIINKLPLAKVKQFFLFKRNIPDEWGKIDKKTIQTFPEDVLREGMIGYFAINLVSTKMGFPTGVDEQLEAVQYAFLYPIDTKYTETQVDNMIDYFNKYFEFNRRGLKFNEYFKNDEFIKLILEYQDNLLKDPKARYEIFSNYSDGTLTIGFYYDDNPMQFSTFIECLSDDKFILKFTETLKIMKKDYYFESSKINSQYDTFVIRLVPTDNFQTMTLDYSSFLSQFNNNKRFAVFNSMSNDGTRLIVPSPNNVNSEYFITMRRFLKYADVTLIREFFHVLAGELKTTKTPLYMKTHGLAVPYFHFRLQHNNKYYETPDTVFEKIKEMFYPLSKPSMTY